jgi:hypothetical protein
VADETLFRIAMAPSAFLIEARYIAWPFAVIGLSMLVYFKIKPDSAWAARLVLMQRAMAGLAVFLGLSLIIAYFMIPEHDQQVGVFRFAALLGSLPVLIPSALALFLSPTPKKSRVVHRR